MKQITLKALYEKVTNLQRDIAQIKKTLIEEPELREDFILRMRNIDLEKSIAVEDFGKRYGLK
jgi:regulator of replication initiation timing